MVALRKGQWCDQYELWPLQRPECTWKYHQWLETGLAWLSKQIIQKHFLLKIFFKSTYLFIILVFIRKLLFGNFCLGIIVNFAVVSKKDVFKKASQNHACGRSTFSHLKIDSWKNLVQESTFHKNIHTWQLKIQAVSLDVLLMAVSMSSKSLSWGAFSSTIGSLQKNQIPKIFFQIMLVQQAVPGTSSQQLMKYWKGCVSFS